MPIRIHSPTPIFEDKRWTMSCHSGGRFRSRRGLDWAMGEHMKADLVLAALDVGLNQRKP